MPQGVLPTKKPVKEPQSGERRFLELVCHLGQGRRWTDSEFLSVSEEIPPALRLLKGMWKWGREKEICFAEYNTWIQC